MAELRYPRFENIYPSREDAVSKLDGLTRSYAEPVTIRYYGSNGKIYIILAVYKSSRKGDYVISFNESNFSGTTSASDLVYMLVKADDTKTDLEYISEKVLNPRIGDITILTDTTSEIIIKRSYVWSGSSWEVLSSGGAEGTVGNLVLGDSVKTGIDENGNQTLEVNTDGTTLITNEDGSISVGQVNRGTF